jgi:hypothetical protein
VKARNSPARLREPGLMLPSRELGPPDMVDDEAGWSCAKAGDGWDKEAWCCTPPREAEKRTEEERRERVGA